MSEQQRVTITSPVARMVGGSFYTPNTKNFEGKPLTVMSGPNLGQPRVDFYIAVAIPKTPGKHWAEEPWGSPIWAEGHRLFQQAAKSPSFAWKVQDGDSQVPNKRGKRPCDQTGYPGNWVLKFSGGQAPSIYRMEGKTAIQTTERDFIKPGHYVQVNFTVSGNKSEGNPGLFLNHNMVAFRGHHPDGEIVFGPNVDNAGFGDAPLPPGALAAPSAVAMPTPAPMIFSNPNGITQPPSPTLNVVPNHAFVNGPAIPPVPAAAAPVPTAVIPPVPVSATTSPSKQMTALANGVSYQAYIQGGWTDELLIANGYMTR